MDLVRKTRIVVSDMVTLSNASQTIDDKDRRILALVQRDSKLSQAEIAKRVGLSPAAVNERLRKLESAGFAPSQAESTSAAIAEAFAPDSNTLLSTREDPSRSLP